jgi:hypothetical protein
MSQKQVTLIPLVCAKCRTPVPARSDEVAWVCEQCGQGLLLDETPEPGPGACATLPIDVFFSGEISQGSQGRPFWVTRGTVTLSRRDTYKGDEGKTARAFWSQPRLFYIPAWGEALEELVKTGIRLLDQPARMTSGSRVPFAPVLTSPGEIRALAEFMVVSLEANRRDDMRRIEFDLQLEPAQLWILP